MYGVSSEMGATPKNSDYLLTKKKKKKISDVVRFDPCKKE